VSLSPTVLPFTYNSHLLSHTQSPSNSSPFCWGAFPLLSRAILDCFVTTICFLFSPYSSPSLCTVLRSPLSLRAFGPALGSPSLALWNSHVAVSLSIYLSLFLCVLPRIGFIHSVSFVYQLLCSLAEHPL